MHIALAADHAAYALKDSLVVWLRGLEHVVLDLGAHGPERVDYPDYGFRLAEAVAGGEVERGIALCGSGIGIDIAVNRNPLCRCALVSEPLSAAFARRHNDANVLALGARFLGEEMARACITTFLTTDFEGDERHRQRIAKLSEPPFRSPA